MQDRVKGPAIALIVVGILGGALGLLNLVGTALMEAFTKSSGLLNPEQVQELENASLGHSVMNVVLSLLVLGGSAFVIYGGFQMIKLRNWSIALIASIVAMIPFFTCCSCFLGIPAGIWAIAVLVNAEVKQAFDQGNPI